MSALTPNQVRLVTWLTLPSISDAGLARLGIERRMANRERDREKRDKIAVRSTVWKAVHAGADTLGKIRKTTDLSDPLIKSALRFHVKERAVLKNGNAIQPSDRNRGHERRGVDQGPRRTLEQVRWRRQMPES